MVINQLQHTPSNDATRTAVINQKPKAQKPFGETEVSMIKSLYEERRVYLLRPGSSERCEERHIVRLDTGFHLSLPEVWRDYPRDFIKIYKSV